MSKKTPPRLKDLPDLLTVMEVQRFLRINRNLAYELVRGPLHSVRVGRRILVPKAALIRYIENGGGAA